jgi:hypothetical protein
MLTSFRMPVVAQIVFRTEADHKAAIEAISNALGVSSSELIRNILDERLPEWRKKADAKQAKDSNLPHGVTDEEVEKAMTSLLLSVVKKEPIRLYPHDLLSPQSKAVWEFLGYLWKDRPTPPEAKIADRVLSALADEIPATKAKPARR